MSARWEGVKGEPACGKEGSEAFIEGGKWPCRSLRKEEGRESSDVTAKEGLFMDPLPLQQSVSEVGRPSVGPLAGPLTV